MRVYDRFGNRWQQNGPHTFLATFTGNNPGNPQNNNRMDGYSYDAAGNLLSDGVHQYKYDAENHIIQVDAGNTATYAYDPDGNRVQKISVTGGDYGDPVGTWQFLYDAAGHMIQRYDGALWQGNFFAGSRHVATTGAGTFFSHADWLGTERVRNQFINPTLLETCSSLPFGDALTCQGGGDFSTLHFTGKERDSESGLDNFGARFDASFFGRFMSPDEPFADQHTPDPQSWNLYAYGRDNPISFADLDGRTCTKDKDGNFHGDTCGTDTGTGTTPDKVVVKPYSFFASVLCILPCNILDPVVNAIKKDPHAAVDAITVGYILGFPEEEVPIWASTEGGFVNWLKNLERAGTKLTKEQADGIIAQAQKLGVEVRLDPPHGPGNAWQVEHLNIGKSANVHLEVPKGYDNPAVPKGSVRKP